MIVNIPIISDKKSCSSSLRQVKYIIPPKIHVNAYKSLRKSNGTSLINTSLKTPPKQPVIVPINIQTHIDRFSIIAFTYTNNGK